MTSCGLPLSRANASVDCKIIIRVRPAAIPSLFEKVFSAILILLSLSYILDN
jgi:hypothetical protein